MQSLLSPDAFGWRGQRVSTKALVLNSSTWFGFCSPPLLQLIRPSPENVPADPQHMCDTGGPCEHCPQAGGASRWLWDACVCTRVCVCMGRGGGGARERLCFNEVLNSLSGPHSKNARTLIMHMNACGGKRLEGGQEYRSSCNTDPVLPSAVLPSRAQQSHRAAIGPWGTPSPWVAEHWWLVATW